MKHIQLLLVLAVMILVASVESFAAELIDGSNPEKILQIAKGYGSATLDKDNSGDPLIICRTDGTKYGIIFYGCSNGKNCNHVKFLGSWGGEKVSQEKINEWNREKKFGKAYLDQDNDPVLDLIVTLKGGISVGNLESIFSWWNIALKGFKKEVIDK